ncbi:MAG: hypothetical protein LBM65_06615, partial [Oscillospiraceae bacterium]|nr:hypothetical protein [Oscillospiraceae bacterium]
MKLTLKDMLLILWKRLALIILAIIIGAGVSLAYTFVFVKPEYTATAKLYVYNERTDSNYITSGDLTVSKSLVDTYLIIIKSNPVLNEVANKLSKNYPQITPSEILKSFSGSAINETEAFYVSATGTNAQLAQDIVNTIIDVAPEEIIRVVKAASVEIIEPAEFPIMPDWPIQRNLIIGIALGLVFAICYIIIAAYMDSTIHGKNEIMACFNIPIIG